MKTRIACLTVLITFTTAMAKIDTACGQENHPAPVEYILKPDYQVVKRSDLAMPYPERVETRGVGERSDRWITGIKTPSVTLFLPEGEFKSAVLICPGGGYGGLSFDKEGVFVAKWFRERGVAAGVLKYSVHTSDEPLGERPWKEAQYGVQFMKSRFAKNKAPSVGILGFSAGGNLAAVTANRPKDAEANGTNPIAQQDSRVAFQVLVYPVISMEQDITHGGSRRNLLGDNPTDEQVSSMSAEQLVTKDSPPALLIHAADDGAVKDLNSIRFYKACRKQGVSAALHIFERGGHGFGMWSDDPSLSLWPDLLEAWLIGNGHLAKQP